MPRENGNEGVFCLKEGAQGSLFLEEGLNFKVSGQRQLNEAGFQAEQGAPLLATHPWQRSQPGTVTKPQGKCQLEPREDLGLTPKNQRVPPHPAGSFWKGAKALGARQRDRVAW